MNTELLLWGARVYEHFAVDCRDVLLAGCESNWFEEEVTAFLHAHECYTPTDALGPHCVIEVAEGIARGHICDNCLHELTPAEIRACLEGVRRMSCGYELIIGLNLHAACPRCGAVIEPS